ncbi:hypothetical protein AVEN_128731-1 [Araneus ventricosus]|uniref:Uncharacterized protein n=1 Tax=Araneus ventricosus TaxID=182803 RepID=A0A4Y2Q8U1_ARAVE|nr:hypothetical protein AVEN_128731-1 [Araneus ventricosus]
MIETVSSTLNPSADVFIPGKNSNLMDATNYEGGMKDISAPFWTISKMKDIKNYRKGQMRETAKQLVIDYLAEKRNRGEKTITRQEILKILERVLSTSSCKVNPKIMLIEARLSTFPEVGKLKDVETDNEAINCCVAKPFTFDLSVLKPPKPSIFLSSLYGLYRHEQAVRPLLSLTLPPSNLEDNLWSVTSKDLSLWNPYCDEPCTCPPMFGYSLSPSVFGNLFNLDYKCSKEGIHLCRYPPSANGNESMLFNTKPDYQVQVELLEDCIEDESKGESNLEFYSEQLKAIVSGVCDSISDETTEESKTSLMEYCEVNENYMDMLWDADPSEFVRSDEILEDDNCHPLLEMDYPETNEGVTAEIEEIIRRGLSPDHKMDNAKESEVDEGIDTSCCDPPCSIWCKESPKFERSDSVSSSSSVSANIGLLTDTTDFLLNASKGSILSNGETDIESHLHKRIFKRSFSANDCDLSYEERYKINYEVPQFSTSSREDLGFLRRDPINFFKSLRKGESWKDDSGIVTHWSSQEEIDIYSDVIDGSYDQDHAPMWSLFNGEDSLWKPLPECAQDQHSKFMPKRVRDLRRQRSVN